MMHYMLGTSNQYVVRFSSSQNAWVWEAITLRSGSQNYDQYPTYNFFLHPTCSQNTGFY